MNRAYWITGGVVAAAALVWGLAMSRAPEYVPAPGVEAPATEPQAEEAPAPAEPEPTAAAAPAQHEAPAVAPSPAPKPEEQAAPADPPPSITAPERTGPVGELRALYESEPRSSAAPEAESQIEAAFRRPEFPGGLVKSVLCRSSVCKVETRWSPERAIAFMGGFMHLVAEPDPDQSAPFDHNLGIEPVGEERDGTKRIDVYLKRNDPSATH